MEVGTLNIFNKKIINIFAYFLILTAVISSLYIVNKRLHIEKDYKGVEILVNITELESLANANDLTDEELAQKLQEKGVTGVLVKELSLGDLKRSGKVQYYQGSEIYLTPFGNQLPKDLPSKDSNILLPIFDQELEEQIISHLQAKIDGIKDYHGDITVIAIPMNTPNSDSEREKIYQSLDAIGVGFSDHEIHKLAGLGLSIVPQIRDWPNTTDESLKFVAQEIEKIPNLSFIMFNDSRVPGYPQKLKYLGDLLKDKEKHVLAPIGTIEFFNQRGVQELAAYLDKEAVRVHSIGYSEMFNKTPTEVLDRLDLAVNERNIRALFVRFFNMNNPAGALDKNLDFLGNLKTTLENEGYILGHVQQYPSMVYYRIVIFLIGLGAIAGGMLLFTARDRNFLALVLGFLGFLAWAFLFYKAPIMSRKLMAIASVVVFPTLAFVKTIDNKGKSILDTLFSFLQLSAISFIGAILMVGLISDKLFMLKLDQFVGVKIAHIIPLLLIPIFVYGLNKDTLLKIKDFLNTCLTYKILILGALAAGALAFYVIRTGNVSTALVSDFEQNLRQTLQDVLGVRPRTKEFLIGHPFALLLIYYGLNKKNWPLLFIAAIGQISLVNTYAHIHTPLLISLTRSFNGLWLGVLIGLVLIFISQQVIKLGLKKWGER